MDATGLVALESALEPLRAHKCLAILCGVRKQPMALLEKAHLAHHEGVVLCSDPQAALGRSRRNTSNNRPSQRTPKPPSVIATAAPAR